VSKIPNRIIKESICTSDTIDRLTWFEEVFFYRLIVNCDDFGRMDARAAVLRARLFPLKAVTDKQVESALNTLRTAGIVEVYMYDDRPYLQLRTWDRHQQIRAKKSKYPSPSDGTYKSSESFCNQLISDDSKCPRNPIQSESNTKSESEAKCAREAAADPIQEVIALFAQNTASQHLTPYVAQQIAQWCDKAGPALVKAAILDTAKKGKKPWAYIEKPLIEWYDMGIRTQADVDAYLAKREKGKEASRQSDKFRLNPALRYTQRGPNDEAEWEEKKKTMRPDGNGGYYDEYGCHWI